MATFTVRVELHEGTEDNYDDLHSAMKSRGFSRLITSGEGTTYHLPTAEYSALQNWTRDEALNSAKAAAETTGLRYAVLVTESNGRTWSGLKKA